MKVRELIEKLQTLNPDLPVATANPEFGFNFVSKIAQVETVTPQNRKYNFDLLAAHYGSEGDRVQTVVCIGPPDWTLDDAYAKELVVIDV